MEVDLATVVVNVVKTKVSVEMRYENNCSTYLLAGWLAHLLTYLLTYFSTILNYLIILQAAK